jgi:NodT family efflux transporter outer membrane factor (OMF) lipoprotein
MIRRNTVRRSAALAALVLAVGGCAGAPAYHPASILPAGTPAPAMFREAGPWAPADATTVMPAQWWRAFGDPQLDALEDRVAADSPTLAAALARAEAARQALRVAQADALPTVGSAAALAVDRQSDDRPLRSASQPTYFGNNIAGLGAGYEVDLWGRVRDSVAAGRANAVASAEDAAAIRISLQAQLATAYIVLRGLDAQIDLLARDIAVYRQAASVVGSRFSGGVATGIDAGRAGAQLADAEAQLADVQAARARLEHAIASLVGAPATLFALPPSTTPLQPAVIPAGLPSTLLLGRPDVAAAERRMYAANRAIGIARAAFFPTIDLTAGGGTNATNLAGLVAAGNAFWAVGPTLALTLFDGGRRTAQVRAARARWDEASAAYRATALGAFQDVEDSLAALHHYSDEDSAQQRAAEQAQMAADLSMVRYEKGVSNYLDVVTAQTTALFEQRRAIEVRTLRLNAAVALARAVGGGWNPDDRQMVRTERP